MEELLNKLIKRGWKPRGIDQKFEVFIECLPYKKIRVCVKKPDYDYDVYSKRDLVSKSSGLWQFVCENGMIEDEHYCWDGYIHGDDNGRIEIRQKDYRYRVIESALCDEDKLEQFLLDNIKV